MNCLIVDDEPHCSLLLEQYISGTPGLEHIASVHDATKALHLVNTGQKDPDIIFLDIDMPKMTGIEFARRIGNKALVIFTTGYPEYGAEAYRCNAIDYLLKPVKYEQFLEAIQKARLEIFRRQRLPNHIFMKESMGGRLVKIAFNDVLYIQSMGNYTKVFLGADKFYLFHLSLRKLQKMLPLPFFTRIHQSYAVNIIHIESVDGNMIHLKGGIKLQLGTSFRTTFLDSLGNHLV